MNNNSKTPKNSQEPLVSVNLVVHNGEKYIRQCLDSVLAQTYENIEVNILDNCSGDSTAKIISSEYYDISLYHSKLSKGFKLIRSGKNLGTWPGQEELLKYSHEEYVVALSVDVILRPDFVKNAVKVFKKDPQVGAVQGKIYKFELPQLPTTNYQLPTNIIDTCGFKIFRSRRIVNIGHGQEDKGQFGQEREIFAVEGAVPVFRRQALEGCRLKSQGDKIIDPDFFWYGDDLDLAWRMRLFGWKEIFAPTVIAHHDRKTTKSLASGWRKFIKIRETIPMFKRRLDWRNTTLAIIKNDFAVNLLRDLPFIFWRQLRLWGYFLLFEPAMFLEKFRVAKMLPKMLKRRGEIIKKARVSAQEIRRWLPAR
jgi:GT2 family glycosyltransferase